MSSYQTVKNKVRELIVNAITPPPTTVTVTPTETEPIITRGAVQEEELPLTDDKVFFATERETMPEYPYIMITELSNNEDMRSGRNQPIGGVLEVTQYKECIFTIAIYGISETDLASEHDTYRKNLNDIRNYIELASYRHLFKNAFTLQGMTDLRPLSSTNETGYLYRYEFDIRCGYNEEITQNVSLSEGVIIELEENNIHEEIYKET